LQPYLASLFLTYTEELDINLNLINGFNRFCEVFMRLRLGLMLWCWGWLGCASSPGPADESATYGREEGRVWVSGPWEAIKPSSDVDEVIDQLCPVIMRLPLANEGDAGREYCGVIYSLGDGTYYASHPSPLGRTHDGRFSPEKSCYVPRNVRDARGQIVPLGDYHSHPWSPSRMSGSTRDLLRATQLYSIRIQFDAGCNLQKFIPYLDEDRAGELYVRQGKRWKLIGTVKPEDKARGFITPVVDRGTP